MLFTTVAVTVNPIGLLYLYIGPANGEELFPVHEPMDVDAGVPQFEEGKEDAECIPYKLHMNES